MSFTHFSAQVTSITSMGVLKVVRIRKFEQGEMYMFFLGQTTTPKKLHLSKSNLVYLREFCQIYRIGDILFAKVVYHVAKQR